MAVINDLSSLPPDLPAPTDDGACAHLEGTVLPSIPLLATDGTRVDLAKLPGRVVVFAYPRTGRPGLPALVDDWNEIPGARGCTPQTCGYRDLAREFAAEGVAVFGLSSQDSEYQRELVARLNVSFPVLSDAQLELTRALSLPTFTVAGHELIKRLAWVAEDGRIVKVFYPVFPPDQNAATVLSWVREQRRTGG
jgi:peroxiredoxin